MKIVQLSFVVPDLRAAVDGYLALGIGPWQVWDHPPIRDVLYRGDPATADAALAVSYSGGMMIELIQPHDDLPSPFREIIELRGYGFHHYGVMSDDFEPTIAELAGRGCSIALETRCDETLGGGRCFYVDTTSFLPGMLEVMESTPELEALFADIEATSVAWDGGDPVRRTDA
jgi:hypothetical protein